MPPYFHSLLINSSIQNSPPFISPYLFPWIHDFVFCLFSLSPTFFFSFLPIIPFLIYSIWFFLLPIPLFSSHLINCLPLFSLSLPRFFSSLPIIPLLIYSNLFSPLRIQLFSSHLFILHLFHLIFIPSLHTPSVSLSLSFSRLLISLFPSFFFCSPPHLPQYMLFRWIVTASSYSSV